MRKTLLILLSGIFVLLLVGCNTFKNPNSDYCVEGNQEGVFLCKKIYTSYFDTAISLTLYVTEDDTFSVSEVFDDVESILSRYHQLMDKYHAYSGVVNVYSINHAAEGPISIPRELYGAISYGLAHDDEIVLDQVNLFNIALNPVLEVWHDARESALCEESLSLLYSVCPIPSEFIDEGNFETDPDNILMNYENSTIEFLADGMGIDLGGYGKGYVSELITDILDQDQIKYILNAGNSNVKAGGINPNNTDGLYYIALIRPSFDSQVAADYYAVLKIPSDVSVVTSGSNQRFFIGEEDGLVYHHIIDPRTNYPGGEALSVSIIYEDGALADIYSTAIFLMTVVQGQTFVNETAGLEAIWYLEDGTTVTSDGFETYLFELN
ncbi:MAG: FAD:protein FMN transferase [Firmicutes bacterium]|nr:FAD:protein FMN transferase [Bacillota bacterium]